MIEVLTKEQVEEIYPIMFEQTFGHKDIQLPQVVAVLKEEDTIKAFWSGYWHDQITFYIQYCGILPRFQSEKQSYRYLSEAIEKFANDFGAKIYMAFTPNTNTAAMLALIKSGFYVFGMRQDTTGSLLVEWLKQMEN